MRRRLLYSAGGLALTILLISGDPASAADPSARLGRLNCEAGDVAEFDGQRWVCAPKWGGTELVLLDANGERFGTVIDYVSRDPANAILGLGQVLILEDFELPSTGEIVKVLFTVTPEEITGGGGVYFETPDCTGTPWLPSLIQADEPRWNLVTAPASVAGSGEITQRQLFVAVSDISETITAGSLISAGLGGTFGECSPQETPSVTTVIRAELVDLDLHEIFPPPYTLELQDGR